MWQMLAGLGLGAASAYQGQKAQGEANKLNKQALRQAEQEWTMGAPLRRQGMQALGQVEAPIDFGTTFTNLSNPFAAAAGPAPSTASYGNWGQYTTSPEQMDQALSGLRPDEDQFIEDALNATYIGKSGGKMRFASAPGGREFTNSDRAHAMMLRDRRNANLGYLNPTTRRGPQPLNPSQLSPRPARQGMEPLGGY